jgi:protein TonB
MHSVNTPIATSVSLSFLLHGAALAAVLLAYGQVSSSGAGIEIELVRSTTISDQLETDAPRKRNVLHQAQRDAQIDAQIDNSKQLNEKRPAIKQSLASRDVLTSRDSSARVPVHQPAVHKPAVQKQIVHPQVDQDRLAAQQQKVTDEGESRAARQRSTNAAQQQLSMLALLHDSISSNKEYPYLARRQRREGVATVGFILHPDGSIEDAHLVASSHADTLDRAALSAVKRIEPFAPAQDYLDHAAAFKIDVVFNLQ